MTSPRRLLSVRLTGPTLGSLAEAILPPAPERGAARGAPEPRQKRFRNYMREKRRR